MNPSRYFMVPLLMLAGLAYLLAGRYGSEWAWLVAIPLIGVVAVFVFAPQINWWYWQRKAPDLSPSVQAMLGRHLKFYQLLSPERQREFRRRTFLISHSFEATGEGIEEVPQDIPLLLASAAATTTFGRADFLYEGYERVVLYPHPFPSPQYERLHTSELYSADGVLIFSMPHLARSVLESHLFLNLALYEYSKVYQLTYPGQTYPALEWQAITEVCGWSESVLEGFIGLDNLDRRAITATLFFTFPESLQATDPDVYRAMATAFRQDPLDAHTIVVAD